MAKKSARNKNIAVALFILAILVVGGALYAKTRQPVSNQASANFNPQTSTTNGGSSGQSGGVVNNPNNSAGKGSAQSSPTTSAPAASSVSSASGVITLDSPTSGATIGNGTTVSGMASGLSQVQYRIKDTVRGVIAQGPLNVTGGNFSGTIQGLNPGSSTGTLEIFDYKNGNGPEENDVEITVNFK